MKFCDRLQLAREYAKLTQQELINKLGFKENGKPLMSQANLGKMEKNEKANGSIHSIFIAKVCGVSPEWLANEVGEMIEAKEYNLTQELKTHLKVLENLPDYARSEVIRDALKTTELIKKASHEAKRNGTEKK